MLNSLVTSLSHHPVSSEQLKTAAWLDRICASAPEDCVNKQAFHRLAKRLLRAFAVAAQLEPRGYRLYSSWGGPAVAGEVILHSPAVYVQVRQSFGGERALILYRTCAGMRDYCGGPNQYAHAIDLVEPKRLIEAIRVGLGANLEYASRNGEGVPQALVA